MIKLFNDACEFVSSFYSNEESEHLLYHNFQHSITLTERANFFLESKELTSVEVSIVQFVLIFSNTGFVLDYDKPFENSIEIFNRFASERSLEHNFQNQVIQALRSLSPFKSDAKLDRICNDLYYSDYGTKTFYKRNSLIKEEHKLSLDKTYSNAEWNEYLIQKLTQHKYYTFEAKQEWESTKRKNLAKLLDNKDKKGKVVYKEKTKAYYKQKFKNESPERGIQTLYRVALRNHLKLSDIADTKANILLSVNAIIISLIIANILTDLDEPSKRFMILPTIIFVTFSIISMIMSIKATQPNVTRHNFTRKELNSKKVNLAFFGNFNSLEYDIFQEYFSKLIKNKTDVYNTLTKDLYYLGQVLDTKYRLLKYTYLIFMIGTIISVIAFAISFILRNDITL